MSDSYSEGVRRRVTQLEREGGEREKERKEVYEEREEVEETWKPKIM